ncbi:MAG: glycosyltransferase family 4 protein [Patescibacteria group bacterium]|nr:glycosyltransferase family 4 protein [Patescibacteria group bacterium]MDE2116759.1 glycosyltransferase family 4 protein [Patescibacteria group bacterium]
MAAKRALIFSLVYYPDFIGGAELAVKEITDRIAPDDIEFHMMTLRTGAEPTIAKIGNITVHRIGFRAAAGPLLVANKYLFPFMAACRASRLNKVGAFDFTWAIMANYAGFAALFFKIFHMNIPFVLTLQEGDPIEYILGRTRIVSRLFRMIFTHADRIQAISRYLADFARNMAARAKKDVADRTVVVPNGVDVDRFSRFVIGGELEAIRREIGKKPGDVFLVTASRLVTKNAVGDIVAALRFLPENVRLLIIGKGELESSLRAQAKSLGLMDAAPRVIFKGFIPHEDLPKYLQACDIFVRPSLSEGFGNSFIEAMAAGLPVIATPVGGIVDFLRDKETGLFCEIGSPADIARKAEIYIRDKSLRDEIIDNALHMVVDHYDWKIVARDMREKVFEPVLSLRS